MKVFPVLEIELKILSYLHMEIIFIGSCGVFFFSELFKNIKQSNEAYSLVADPSGWIALALFVNVIFSIYFQRVIIKKIKRSSIEYGSDGLPIRPPSAEDIAKMSVSECSSFLQSLLDSRDGK